MIRSWTLREDVNSKFTSQGAHQSGSNGVEIQGLCLDNSSYAIRSSFVKVVKLPGACSLRARAPVTLKR